MGILKCEECGREIPLLTQGTMQVTIVIQFADKNQAHERDPRRWRNKVFFCDPHRAAERNRPACDLVWLARAMEKNAGVFVWREGKDVHGNRMTYPLYVRGHSYQYESPEAQYRTWERWYRENSPTAKQALQRLREEKARHPELYRT